MQIHGRCDHDRQTEYQAAFAQNHFAVAVGELLVPAVGQVGGRRSHSGALVGVIVGIRIGLPLILPLIEIMGVGSAWTVIRGHFLQANGIDCADGVERGLREMHELLDGNLAGQLVPTLVIIGSALHIVESQAA